MGTVIWVTCEDSSLMTPYDTRCAPLEIADPAQLDEHTITAALAAAGWSRDDNGHHCPTHNPALRGFPIRLEGGTLIEPIPGLRLRLAPEEIRNVVRAEILLDRERFDVEGDKHIWRAKPVGTDWPGEAPPVDHPEPPLRTPDEWCDLYGLEIVDPDGWRGQDAPPWGQPIGLPEFWRRFASCTVRPVDEPTNAQIVADVRQARREGGELA